MQTKTEHKKTRRISSSIYFQNKKVLCHIANLFLQIENLNGELVIDTKFVSVHETSNLFIQILRV